MHTYYNKHSKCSPNKVNDKDLTVDSQSHQQTPVSLYVSHTKHHLWVQSALHLNCSPHAVNDKDLTVNSHQ